MSKKNSYDKVDYSKVLLTPDSPFLETEAFKTIRTGMLYSSRGEDCPVYAVTSSFAHSGKSVVSANLALTFSQLGKKVLLIDLDMRCPVQSKIFRVAGESGVSEVLAGLEKDPRNAVCKTHVENLWVMTSGRIPPNPTELLSGQRMRTVLNQMREMFDYIFLDLPPVGVVSDALILSDLVTGYVYTVRAELDDKPGLRECLEKMRHGGANILGFILNDVNPGTDKKYGKDYYYRYGYRNPNSTQQ